MTHNGCSSQNAGKPKLVVLVICGLGFGGILGFCLVGLLVVGFCSVSFPKTLDTIILEIRYCRNHTLAFLCVPLQTALWKSYLYVKVNQTSFQIPFV